MMELIAESQNVSMIILRWRNVWQVTVLDIVWGANVLGKKTNSPLYRLKKYLCPDFLALRYNPNKTLEWKITLK